MAGNPPNVSRAVVNCGPGSKKCSSCGRERTAAWRATASVASLMADQYRSSWRPKLFYEFKVAAQEWSAEKTSAAPFSGQAAWRGRGRRGRSPAPAVCVCGSGKCKHEHTKQNRYQPSGFFSSPNIFKIILRLFFTKKREKEHRRKRCKVLETHRQLKKMKKTRCVFNV